MAFYPVSLEFDSRFAMKLDKGGEFSIYDAWRKRIETWINNQGEKQEVYSQDYLFGEITIELKIPREAVVRICEPLGGGSNGFFLLKEGMPRDT